MAAPPRPNEIPPDRLAAGTDEAEYFAIADDPDDIEIVETEPDGAFAEDPGEREESEPPNPPFYDNLAQYLEQHTKDRISTELVRLITIDKQARGRRDEQYAEGIKRTGMGNDAPGGAQFEGASRAVHPMLTEAAIDYQARIMKELMPFSGPVKPGLIGVPTRRKVEKAKRVADHMNYQITHQIRGARTTLEVMFAQVPLGGSQYIRQCWDHGFKRPSWQFAPIDKVLVPFHAPDFASATRKTFVDTVDKVEFHHRVANGQYLDLDLGMPGQLTDPTKAQDASRKVEGAEDPGMNEDGDREIYETMAYIEVTEDMVTALDAGNAAVEEIGELCPYLVSIDSHTNKMLAMYRSWEDGDAEKEPIEHLFEFALIPWRGAYAIGFPQIIGGLSGAATGALRALLDSAHVNNIPSGLILKGSGVSGQSTMPEAGELKEVDGGTETDDIRKRVMPMPFNPPAPVLFQLLGFLVDAGRGVVRTTLDETPQNSGSPVPVGTQISRVEEGLVVFSAVHGRAHEGMDRLLRGLHRLNRLYLPEEIKVDAQGKEILVRRQDYEGPCDISPVSDPTIYSDLQRFSQIGAIQQRQLVAPTLYKPYAVELAFLKLLKWPEPESILNVVNEASEKNAVNENLSVMLAEPIAVYSNQDHLAHMQVHLDFIKSPAFGMNQIIAPAILPPLLAHVMEHIGYLYASETEKRVEEAANVPYESLVSDDPEIKLAFDKMLATASQLVMPQIEAAVQKALPVIMQAAALAKSLAPKPPMDPSAAAVQAATAETQRKTQADQMDHQLGVAKLQQDGQQSQTEAANDQGDNAARNQNDAVRNAIMQDRNRVEEEGQQVAAQTKLQATAMDNSTAEAISADRVASGAGSGLKNGESMTRG